MVQIPLTDVADGQPDLRRRRSSIAKSQERYIPIKFSVRGRDLGSAVLEAQQKVADQRACMPGGYHLEWVGEFGNLEEAHRRGSKSSCRCRSC